VKRNTLWLEQRRAKKIAIMIRHSLLMALAASVATSTPTAPAISPRFVAASNATIKCPIIFDGRIPSAAKLADFDTSNGGGWSPFNPDYVKGQNLKWSEILLFPETTTPSRFDSNSTKAVEVTLNDKSIFMTQKGFRRAGLQFNKDSNNGSPAGKGAKTIHFSILQDPARKLNLTHEYLVSVLKSRDMKRYIFSDSWKSAECLA
jgi:hypothetical protein